MRLPLPALLTTLLSVTPTLALNIPEKLEAKETASEKQFVELMKEFRDLMTHVVANRAKAVTNEERKLIEDEFQLKYDKLAAQFLTLGKTDLKADLAFTALTIATSSKTTDQEAIELAVKRFGDDEKILQLVPMLIHRQGGMKWLDTLADSKNKAVRGGLRFHELAREMELVATHPAHSTERRKRAFAKGTIELAELVKQHGDVKLIGAEGLIKLKEAAATVMYLMEHLSIGQVLEDVDCPVLDGEKLAKISDYRGKVVVLYIWATSLETSLANITHHQEMVKKLKNKPFSLISVSTDDKKETLTKFLKKTEMPWIHWHTGPQGQLLKKYQIRSFPTSYVLDSKGVIRYRNIRGEELESAVEELIHEAEKE